MPLTRTEVVDPSTDRPTRTPRVHVPLVQQGNMGTLGLVLSVLQEPTAALPAPFCARPAEPENTWLTLASLPLLMILLKTVLIVP